MKLALGTVQFGLDYGISNSQGKIALAEINNILTSAKSHGITTLDTATAYGDSETILGQLQAEENFALVTKIPSLASLPLSSELLTSPSLALQSKCTQAISIDDIVEGSLSRLKTKQLKGLMFHSADDLLGSLGHQHFTDAKALKAQKKIKQLGVSVYSPKQLTDILASYKIDIVQFPLSCLDQRFIQPSLQQRLLSNGIEVHVRSLFLQGLILMPVDDLSQYFQPYKHILMRFKSLCDRLNCQPLTLALSIIHANPFIDKAVIGCCSVRQLDQIVEHYHLAKQLDVEHKELVAELAYNDEALINPSNWPIQG